MDYYCDKNKPLVMISGNSSGNIYSLYQGDTFYQNNQHCQWLIDAGADNLQIQLMVKKSDLEWAPEGAICSDQYDFVDVRDGKCTDDNLDISWYIGESIGHYSCSFFSRACTNCILTYLIHYFTHRSPKMLAYFICYTNILVQCVVCNTVISWLAHGHVRV